MYAFFDRDPKIIQLIKAFNKTFDKNDAAYKQLEINITAAISEAKDVNSQDYQEDRSALHCAAMAGDIKLVEMLLAKGADINLQDTYGQTPLYIAAMYRHDAVVRRLLDNGADVNIKANDGHTPLSIAASQENKIIACFMLALLASLAIAALGVLAVCGISCSLVLCLAVAIVSCVPSLVFLHLLDKQNTQRQERTSESTQDNSVIGQTDKTSRHKFLVGACVVLHISAGVSAAFCPPLCLVVIGMLISLLGTEFSGRTPNKMLEIMQQANAKSQGHLMQIQDHFMNI
jgi:ankyrin repeat protein